MNPVLTCVEWHEATATCTQQAWVKAGTLVDLLPDLATASQISGSLMLAGCAVIAATLLIPPKGNDDE